VLLVLACLYNAERRDSPTRVVISAYRGVLKSGVILEFFSFIS
jgi:hypothetical protein